MFLDNLWKDSYTLKLIKHMIEEERCRLLEITGEKIRQAEAAFSNSATAVRQVGEASNTLEDPLPVWDAQGQVGQRSAELGRWRSFQRDLREARVMDRVGLGARVRISIDGQPEETLLVMRTRVVLPDILVITPETPVARAINGQSIPFSTTFEAPKGPSRVEILEIH